MYAEAMNSLPIQIVFPAAGALLVTGLLRFTWRDRDRAALICKTLASLCFVLLALTGGGMGTFYGRMIGAGLLLGMIGDICLGIRGDRWFLAGLVAFLGGHLCYASAFFELSAPHWWDPLIFTCVALLGSAVITWLKPVVGRMLAPVYAYAAVIMLMLIGGLNALNHVDDRLLCWSVVAGACLFVVSDLFVARQRFVRPGRINPMIGLPLYYISQFILAMTPAFYTR